MRRTITTLMFLAVGGLAFAAQAADPGKTSGDWNYYAAGQSRYRISDDDDGSAASNATEPAVVSAAVGTPQTVVHDQQAVYVTERTKSAGELLQTNYFAPGAACGGACGSNNCCNSGCNSCLSDSCGCDCYTSTFRFELLGWFTRGRNTPALVTTSPTGTDASDSGVLGLPDTTVLYGNDPIGTNIRSGARLTFSHLFSDGITEGTLRFWGIEDGSETFATSTDVRDIIARPFYNVVLVQNDAFLVAHPDVAAPGSIRVLSKNDLIGGDAWLSRTLSDDGYGTIDLLAGYQFSRMDDSLAISSSSSLVDPFASNNGVAPGTVVTVSDSFRTQNEFHGASMGGIARSYRGLVTLEGMFKVAMGNMRQSVIVNGSTGTTPPGGTTTPSAGGLLAQPTNIGSQQNNRFAYVPELNLNMLYDVNPNLRLIGGYSFMYWSSVVLAGDQIDTSLNLTQVPGPIIGGGSPQSKFQRTDFWVQGISLGADYRW